MSKKIAVKAPKVSKVPNKAKEIVEPEPEIVPEPEVKAKPEGKVKQIEVLIVEILKEAPITKKEMIGCCPEEHNKATWQTRIYRLISSGVISFDKESKMLRVN